MIMAGGAPKTACRAQLGASTPLLRSLEEALRKSRCVFENAHCTSWVRFMLETALAFGRCFYVV